MKKLLVLLAIMAIIPVALFADLGVGGAVLYNSPVLLGQPVDIDLQNIDQFSFGVDVRYKLSFFQAEGLLLGSIGDFNSMDIYLDAGIGLDIEMITLMLGAGPNLSVNFGTDSLMQVGLNVKATAEVVIEMISFGATYIMDLHIDNGVNITASSGLLGVQVLYWFR